MDSALDLKFELVRGRTRLRTNSNRTELILNPFEQTCTESNSNGLEFKHARMDSYSSGMDLIIVRDCAGVPELVVSRDDHGDTMESWPTMT